MIQVCVVDVHVCIHPISPIINLFIAKKNLSWGLGWEVTYDVIWTPCHPAIDPVFLEVWIRGVGLYIQMLWFYYFPLICLGYQSSASQNTDFCPKLALKVPSIAMGVLTDLFLSRWMLTCI